MKSKKIAAVIVGAFVAVTFANVTSVQARDVFSFSFNTGDVAFAYSDGYWDRNHQWHGWRNAREHREWRDHNPQSYKAVRHTRELNKGWRNDQDHDGVPNQFDRDRDGDGVSNRRDDAPNNPNRH